MEVSRCDNRGHTGLVIVRSEIRAFPVAGATLLLVGFQPAHRFAEPELGHSLDQGPDLPSI
jgi:hypothetical protein